MRVFITDISGNKSIVVARALSGVPGLEVLGGDHRAFARHLHTRFAPRPLLYSDPGRFPDRFVEDISRMIVEESIDHVIPVNTTELRPLIQHRDRLGGTLDYMGDERAFRRLDNKEELSQLTRELNLPVPRHYRLEDVIDRFPLVFKPAESSSSHGVRYIHDPHALDALRAQYRGAPYVLQEYVIGFGAGYSVLAREGKVLAGCGHRRRAEWPVTGGSSMIRSYFEHPEMERIAARVMEHTGLSGVAMFEFKVTPDNQVRLIEVNPRMWGSLYQSIASGVNFPLLLFRPDLANSIVLQKNTITYYSPHHLRSLLYYILDQHDFGPLFFLISNIFRAKPDVSLMQDPAGYLSLLYRFVKVRPPRP